MPGVFFDVTSRVAGSTATAYCNVSDPLSSGGTLVPADITCDGATRRWNMSAVWCEGEFKKKNTHFFLSVRLSASLSACPVCRSVGVKIELLTPPSLSVLHFLVDRT